MSGSDYDLDADAKFWHEFCYVNLESLPVATIVSWHSLSTITQHSEIKHQNLIMMPTSIIRFVKKFSIYSNNGTDVRKFIN